MSDAGEGLIDADSRIQERMDELARARAEKAAADVRDPDAVREMESLRLARTELERQLEATTHERRRAQLAQALEEISKRAAAVDQRLKKAARR
jgi:hypothetical protein